mgnify:CR=1 FL=1
MTRKMRAVTTSIGGVEIVVTDIAPGYDHITAAAIPAAVAGGYAAGIAAAVMLCVAAAQSALVWPIVVCGGVAVCVAVRCRR